MRGQRMVAIVVGVLAGCAAPEGPAQGDAIAETAALGSIRVRLDGCDTVETLVRLERAVYDTANHTSRPVNGLFPQALRIEAYTCSASEVGNESTGPVSGSFVGVLIEDPGLGMQEGDSTVAYYPVEVVVSPGPLQDAFAAVGIATRNGTTTVTRLPSAGTATVDGEVSFRISTARQEMFVNPTFVSSRGIVGPLGWISDVRPCSSFTPTTAHVIETGTSRLDEAATTGLLHGSGSESPDCPIILQFNRH